MKIIKLILCCFGLLIAHMAWAGSGDPAVVHYDDTTRVDRRSISQEKLAEYKKDTQFQYEREANNSLMPSWWTRFWRWFWEKIGHLLAPREGGGMSVMGIIIRIVAVGLLIFFIIKLLGMDKISLFGRKNTGEDMPYEIMEDDIHAISFDDAIRKAEETGNYRMALRLHYLQMLKVLTDRQLIDWKINKTNLQYMRELTDSGIQSSFRGLTHEFEYSWYGDTPVNKDSYAAIQQQFIQFNRQIK